MKTEFSKIEQERRIELAKNTTALYCDGGLLSYNPSKIGGVWAYIGVDKDLNHTIFDSGYLFPSEIENSPVTNNHTEFLAALEALEMMPDWWEGCLITDSEITINRIIGVSNYLNVPDSWMLRMNNLFRRMKVPKCYLFQGHPTKKDFISGRDKSNNHRAILKGVLGDDHIYAEAIGKRKGFPVSANQQWCDDECNRLKIEYRIKPNVKLF